MRRYPELPPAGRHLNYALIFVAALIVLLWQLISCIARYR